MTKTEEMNLSLKNRIPMPAAILAVLCGTLMILSACSVQKQVVSTELVRTSQSWDGVELPDYLQGRPELVAVR